MIVLTCMAADVNSCNVWLIRHLIPLLVKEGRAGLVGFCTALVSASVEHPGHAILAQKLRQEGELIVRLFSTA